MGVRVSLAIAATFGCSCDGFYHRSPILRFVLRRCVILDCDIIHRLAGGPVLSLAEAVLECRQRRGH